MFGVVIPWRGVVRAELYAGPRNGLRFKLTLDCGHAMTRQLRPNEQQTKTTKQCAARCYPCYWREHRPPPHRTIYHAP